MLVSIDWEKRWLVVLELFDRSKASSDELKMMTPMKDLEWSRHSSAN